MSLVDALAASPMTGCPCCDNLGIIPKVLGDVGIFVPGEVILRMCEPCILAAFLSDGKVAHPHEMAAG